MLQIRRDELHAMTQLPEAHNSAAKLAAGLPKAIQATTMTTAHALMVLMIERAGRFKTCIIFPQGYTPELGCQSSSLFNGLSHPYGKQRRF